MATTQAVITSLVVLLSITQHGSAQSICTQANTCDDCLQLSPDCVWCSQIYFNQSARCFLMADRGNCSDGELVNVPGNLTLLMNNLVDQQVLVSPQRVQIKLRLGQPESLRIVVNRVRNAPLDLYFVVDQSFSMLGSLNTLKSVVGDLFSALSDNITNNSRVGMGLFVDKPIAPYIGESPDSLRDPCAAGCSMPYGFRHILPLTNNVTEFQTILNNQVISGNLDDPEGGLDAVLQAIVCEDIIGWRESSLRMLVHVSDASIHVAGDGLVAGIVLPPVRECLLERNGPTYFYNSTIIYDYPSLSMIDELLRENDITLVFGALRQTDVLLETLRSELPTAIVEQLSDNSSNIIDAIQDAYSVITTNITLRVNAPDGIVVTFIPDCLNNDGQSCLNVGFNQTVAFNVSVTATSCDSDFVRNVNNFTINVPGYGNVDVVFQGICSCGCSDMAETNSAQCSDVGTLRCGLCDCPLVRDGVNCECDENTPISNTCPRGTSNNEICSGPERGMCQCGKCVCINNFFGDACQCDSISCERDADDNICGGPARGRCGCNGTCTCLNDWTGSACDCTPEQTNCRDRSALICSNRGSCECNECVCDSEDFTGQFCQICTAEVCPTEPACLAYGDCVVCRFGTQGTGGRSCSNAQECDITRLQRNQSFDRVMYEIPGSASTLACITTEGDCSYRYFVGTTDSTDGQPPIVFESEICSQADELAAWIIIVIILGVLLLLGILVLIGIRIFMELRYRYEYQQWLKEKESARFGQQENPLYTKATTDIDNPLYDKKKRQKEKEAEASEM